MSRITSLLFVALVGAMMSSGVAAQESRKGPLEVRVDVNNYVLYNYDTFDTSQFGTNPSSTHAMHSSTRPPSARQKPQRKTFSSPGTADGCAWLTSLLASPTKNSRTVCGGVCGRVADALRRTALHPT